MVDLGDSQESGASNWPGVTESDRHLGRGPQRFIDWWMGENRRSRDLEESAELVGWMAARALIVVVGKEGAMEGRLVSRGGGSRNSGIHT